MQPIRQLLACPRQLQGIYKNLSQQAQPGYVVLRPGTFLAHRVNGNDVIGIGADQDWNVQSGSNFQALIGLLVDRRLARQFVQ